VIRDLNIALGLVCLFWLGIRSYIRWHEYPYAVRLFMLTLSFYIFGVTFGSIEVAVAGDWTFGARTAVFLLANLSMLVTLALTQKRRSMTRNGNL
jgi:hypothetical protein